VDIEDLLEVQSLLNRKIVYIRRVDIEDLLEVQSLLNMKIVYILLWMHMITCRFRSSIEMKYEYCRPHRSGL